MQPMQAMRGACCTPVSLRPRAQAGRQGAVSTKRNSRCSRAASKRHTVRGTLPPPLTAHREELLEAGGQRSDTPAQLLQIQHCCPRIGPEHSVGERRIQQRWPQLEGLEPISMSKQTMHWEPSDRFQQVLSVTMGTAIRTEAPGTAG